MIGWAEGDQQEPPGGKKKTTQHPRTNPETLAIRMAWRKEHTGPQSGQGPAVSPAHADSTCTTWCFRAVEMTPLF